jgi:DNA polymerase-3 subunit epsilon
MNSRSLNNRNRPAISQTFTAIDFETANYQRNSACQLGIVVVENGTIIDTQSWLIKPPSMMFTFTDIHGITYEVVKDQPTFQELWTTVQPYIDNRILAAHNATFDISVLRAVLSHYRLPAPAFQVLDSLAVARRTWPHLPNHKLNTVAGHLNFPFQHHDAANDARACAEIILQAAKEAAASV